MVNLLLRRLLRRTYFIGTKMSHQTYQQPRNLLTRDQLFAQIEKSNKLLLTNAAMVRLQKSSIQWLKAIWNYVDSKPDFWRATITAPNTVIGTGSTRLALEIRPIHRAF